MDRTSKPYRHSFQEAMARGELSEWWESHRANILCKKAIETAIREDFDGAYLSTGCAQRVIGEFGMDRVAYVLANTLQVKDWDGRFSHTNREWFKKITVPQDTEHSCEFAVDSHSTVLDGFMNQFRKVWQECQHDLTPQTPELTM